MVYTHLNTKYLCSLYNHGTVPDVNWMDVYTTTKFYNKYGTHLNTKYLCSMYWMFTLQQSLYNQIWYTLI